MKDLKESIDIIFGFNISDNYKLSVLKKYISEINDNLIQTKECDCLIENSKSLEYENYHFCVKCANLLPF